METIGERLAFLIKKRNSNPNKISKATKIHASTIKNYIDNSTTPDYLKLDAVATFLESNYKWVSTGEGNEDDFVNNESTKIKSEIKEVEFDEFMEAEYLPIKVQAGYLSGLEEKHPIELKKMLVPKEFEKGFYKVIEIEGDSMNDGTPRSICDGDKLLLKEIEGGDYLQKTLPYRTSLFVIVSREGIVCKQILSQDIEKKCITCHSFNSSHPDYEICFEDIYQLFYVKKLVERKIKF